MVCRAPSSSATCSGSSPTGQVLSYDNEGQLTGWQNTPTSPTSTDAFAYDGEGSRVAQRATANGVTTTTDYVLGGLEEVTSSGGTSTLTEYYPIPGIGTAVRVGTALSYLASDGLGSVSVALDPNGNVTAQQLYSPYGMLRYSSGSMPTVTDHGYTGQVADSFTGLDDYGARSYDPTLGQFTQADTPLAGGLNRYAYVAGNPTSYIDPSGHELLAEEDPGNGDGENASDLANGSSGGSVSSGESVGRGTTGLGASASGSGTGTGWLSGDDVTIGDATWLDDGQTVRVANPNGSETLEDAALYTGDLADVNDAFSRAELNAEQRTAEPPQPPQPPQSPEPPPPPTSPQNRPSPSRRPLSRRPMGRRTQRSSLALRLARRPDSRSLNR